MEWKIKLTDPMKAKEYFRNKLQFTVGPVEVKHYKDQGEKLNIIDVREKEDYEQGHIPGAINLPEERWNDLQTLSKDKPNVIYCYNVVCHLAAKAAHHFAEQGYPVIEMEGGYESWKESGLEEERAAA